MCLMDKFCCCLLRTGSYVIATLSILLAALNIAVSGVLLYLHDNDLKRSRFSSRVNRNESSVVIQTPPEVYVEGASVALAIILIIASILLIIGTATRIRKMLLPWVAMAILNCVLHTAAIIINIVVIALGKGRPLGSIFLSIAEILILIYCISAVMSLYKNDCYEIGESRQKDNVVRYNPVRREVYTA